MAKRQYTPQLVKDGIRGIGEVEAVVDTIIEDIASSRKISRNVLLSYIACFQTIEEFLQVTGEKVGWVTHVLQEKDTNSEEAPS